MEIKIELRKWYYVVLVDGKFYCSADSYSEAFQDMCELESEMSTAQN